MKIKEVRDGIIKFETDEIVALSSFIKIDSEEKSYVAQIIQIKPSDKIAFAKILFLYDGELKDYDKTSPSTEAKITDFTSDMIDIAVHYTKPVAAGQILGGTKNIALDFSAFDKKALICSDSAEQKNTIIKNLAKQFNNLGKKVIVIDTLGTIEAKKYTAGRDFKLPLNKASLMFMYEECLNDATTDSKNTIVEIFKDLAEYSQTVPFVPFGALKSIVDEMVDKSHVFKLLVLKNKLTKYDAFGYFAKAKEDVLSTEKAFKSNCTVIDVSKLDTIFQNRYISYIYELFAEKDVVVFLELSNSLTKKTLKNVMGSSLATTCISHSRFKYLSDIKNLFDNFILFPSESLNNMFNIYSTFLRSMDKKDYLIVGEATSYIPFVSAFAPSDVKIEPKIADEEILDEIVKSNDVPEDENSVETYYEAEEPSDEIIAEINEKSMDTIANIAENLETPEEIDMFGDEEESDTGETQEMSIENTDGIPEEISEDIIPDSEPEESADIPTEDLEEALSEKIEDTTAEVIEYAAEAETVIPEEVIQEDGFIEETEISEDIENIDTEIELGDDFDIDLSDEISENNDITEEIPEETEEEPQTEIEQEEVIVERDVIPLEDEFNVDEITELNPEDASPDDILIDMSEEDEISPEEVDEQIKKEVDKVYTTRKEEDFTENDLDLIDELNNENDTLIEAQDDDAVLEELAEQGEILEEYHPDSSEKEDKNDADEILETRSAVTPMVPVYDAEIPDEDLVESDPIQQGDSVTHVRFGNGVVEKLVKYGSKTLFMINFDNGGRRLLDPLLTEIKKV